MESLCSMSNGEFTKMVPFLFPDHIHHYPLGGDIFGYFLILLLMEILYN